ncbi:MAG: UbiA family prenyltransferase [Candidatus Nezhaarchaeota archaeon]|nr:UbiA family prenyltransferase [Candidatus Nezhaarchaeota archaeon]
MILRPYIELMRPINSLLAGIATIIGFLVASGFNLTPHHSVRVLLAFSSAFMLSSSSMAINDYFDREIDAINQPSRPIPSGRVSPREALIFSLTLMVLGILLSTTINFEAFLIAILACSVFVAYSAYLKRSGLLGNVAVSLCVSLTFIYGSTAFGSLTALLVLFSITAFLATMSREIVKGIADVEGDRLKGIKSLAASLGLRAASHIALAFMVVAIATSFIPIVYGLVNWLYAPLIAFSDAGLLLSSLTVCRSPSPQRAVKSKKVMLIFMGLALAAFLAGCIEI